MSNKKHSLTIFSLTMITVGSVDSIRNLPATALFGSQLIFFYSGCLILPYPNRIGFGRVSLWMGQAGWSLYLG